tara:strand:- start:38 stop:1213 length:1176 start_codon:yes stop_codon:yes gene_type:complete
MEYLKLKTLLNASKEIVETHIKDKEERGEDFNVFSILGMETNETKTHSAMLVALLDPEGNHYYKEQFLKLFLEEIGYINQEENLNLTQVKAEYHLGKISEDYTTGGFIDILITFPSGKAIAIENKIDAEDQKNQLYRYSLFKGKDCALYYLNKEGKAPTKNSLLSLTDNGYDIISYNHHILNWLEKCLSIVKTGSIVENVIKQYQILIKNLTNTMDKQLENNLNDLIVKNLSEAKYIHSHYEKAVNSIREKLRNAIYDKIKTLELPTYVYLGNDVTHVHSQIWLSSDMLDNKNTQFGLESFSGKGNNNGRIFIGLFSHKNNYDALRDGDYRLNSYWPLVSDIKTPNNNPLNLNSTATLEKLSTDSDYFNELVNSICDQVTDFVNTYYALFE